mmetsp:Transcript_10090/g.12354  ORF Transcript_10090/g.12354 Transcript_10090/m.12354 type:complete len:148 (+) Transcript_10090:56-499(+)
MSRITIITIFQLLLLAISLNALDAFISSTPQICVKNTSALNFFGPFKQESEEEPEHIPKIEKKKFNLFSGLDDALDDFMNKRMGKGEIFYGKRKNNPSGEINGDYNGFGLSSREKIEVTQDRKDEWLAERQMRQDEEEFRRLINKKK